MAGNVFSALTLLMSSFVLSTRASRLGVQKDRDANTATTRNAALNSAPTLKLEPVSGGRFVINVILGTGMRSGFAEGSLALVVCMSGRTVSPLSPHTIVDEVFGMPEQHGLPRITREIKSLVSRLVTLSLKPGA